MNYEYEEDEIDLNNKKVEIIEDEDDKPIINKKVIKYVVIGLLLLVVVIGLVLIIRKPEKEERILPYSVEDSNGYSKNVVDIGDRDYEVVEIEVGDKVRIEGIVKESGNILDKPSPYGYGLKGIQQGEKVEIVGEVVLEGERTGWIIVRKDDIEGYLNEEKVEINIEEEESNLTEEERDRLSKTSEELIKEMGIEEEEEDMSKESEEIKGKALLEEMERVIEIEEEKNQSNQGILEDNQGNQEQGIEGIEEEQIEIERPIFHNQVDNKYYDNEGNVIE